MNFEASPGLDASKEELATDEDLIAVEGLLNDAGYDGLADLLSDLADKDDGDVTREDTAQISSAFARSMALNPESAEALGLALESIQIELPKTGRSNLVNRAAFLADLSASPLKYFQKNGNTLNIFQPANSVRFTRINDFIGPNGIAKTVTNPSEMKLVRKNKIYEWDNDRETWVNSQGNRLKLLDASETISIIDSSFEETKEPQLSYESVYNEAWNAVQPQSGSDGVLRGGFVGVRDQLYMDAYGHHRASNAMRPDPVERTYYYYGNQLSFNPSVHLAYTGKSPERLKATQRIINKGLINTLPTAGGGHAMMEEKGELVLRDYSNIPADYKMDVLDTTYSESLEIIDVCLDANLGISQEVISSVITNKAAFDAQLKAFLWRAEDPDTGYIDFIEDEVYGLHASKVRIASYAYVKSLNKLPSGVRKKIINQFVLPKLNEFKDALSKSVEGESELDAIQIFIKLLERSRAT